MTALVCEKCGTHSRVVKVYSNPHSPVDFKLCNLCRDELKADMEGENE